MSTAWRLRVCSFNVRYDTPADGPDAWEHRRRAVIDTLDRIEADVIGLQEPLAHQLETIRAEHQEYEWYGEGRLGDDDGEYCPVGWRTDRIRPSGRETRWLSPTPSVPGSRGWDAALPRIATRIRVSNGDRPLTVWNTHFDHEGDRARRKAAELLTEWAAADSPTVVMGDFNAAPKSPPYTRICAELRDARTVAETTAGPRETFHSFTGVPDRAIDHIFVSDGIDVELVETVTGDEMERLPSDHFPVVADLRLGSS